jgi:hypothetical protein
MLHRILESIFFIQVAVESLVEGAREVGEDALLAAHSKMRRRRHRSPRPQMREHNNRHNRHEPPEHTLEDLPPKFYSLFRQFSRYVFVSILGELLGKE